jgi:hypothetical protein
VFERLATPAISKNQILFDLEILKARLLQVSAPPKTPATGYLDNILCPIFTKLSASNNFS